MLRYRIIFAFISLLGIASCTIPDLRTSPVVASSEAKYVTPVSATIDCEITDQGGAVVTDRGICFGTVPMPNTEDSKMPYDKWALRFTIYLTGLEINTKYYARAYAANEKGISYGDQITFTTKTWVNGTVTDYDGNTYSTFKISDFDQVWMQENLKVTHYSNGDPIPEVTDDTEWGDLTSGAYCVFNNNPDIQAIYGLLYNAYVAVDERNVCPVGWHVPAAEEWEALSDYLGGYDVSGGKLKEEGTVHWWGENVGADNSSGFMALPGSSRHKEGVYVTTIGVDGYWWSSTKSSSSDMVFNVALYYYFAWFGHSKFDLNHGCSIRCIRD